jgi:hypothetical protein
VVAASKVPVQIPNNGAVMSDEGLKELYIEELAEVRREMVVKPPKSFKISLGGREVCTTF